MTGIRAGRPARHAAHCRFLRVTLGRGPDAGLHNVCLHIVREGSQCVGPFLDESPTTCGLWEPAELAPHTANQSTYPS
jgi:hypothetical protein